MMRAREGEREKDEKSMGVEKKDGEQAGSKGLQG